jgi:hypothetical protein
MAKLVVHIGTHKTGTSVIQHFLKKNKEQLSDEGINLLKFKGRRETQKLDRYSKEFTKFLKQNIDLQISHDKINLISFEGLSGSLETLYSNYRALADTLAEATNHHHTELIIFFRRQDQFIQSSYMQMMHQSNNIAFSDFYNREKLNNLSWLRFFEYYCKHFGQENVTVLPYSPIRFINESIINVFGKAIDSSLLSNEKENRLKNVGFSPEALQVFNALADHLNERERKKIRRDLQKKYHNGIFREYKFLDVKERDYIVEKFKDENATLASNHWDKNYFDFNLSEENRKRKFTTEDIYNQIVVASLKNERRLESELQSVKNRLSRLEMSFWAHLRIILYQQFKKSTRILRRQSARQGSFIHEAVKIDQNR